MANKAISKVRPGFVRVLIPERNKTIQIRTKNANNPNYMAKHGLVVIPEPQKPPVVFQSPVIDIKTITESEMEVKQVTEPAPKVTKASPVKTSRNGQ